MRRLVLSASALLCISLTSACASELDNPRDANPRDGSSTPSGQPTSTDSANPVPDGVPGSPSVSASGPIINAPQGFTPGEARLRRLTIEQYGNTLRDLFGEPQTIPGELEPVIAVDGMSAIGAANITLSTRGIEQFEAAAIAITERVFADANWRTREVACGAQQLDTACIRQFLASFGKRAWRRPLSDPEVERWSQTADAVSAVSGDAWQGLRWAVAGMLQSPHFLYRVELGASGVHPPWLTLDGYELASKSAYVIWNTMPDQELLSAAESGILSTHAGFLAQVERLLASPQARAGIASFWADYLRLDDVTQLTRPAGLFSQLTPTLFDSMRQETLALFQELVFENPVDIRAFISSKHTYLNDELASAYGLPLPGSGATLVKVTLPDGSRRAGYLGQGSFLALNAHETFSSPTRRGKFVRKVLLCQSVPPPPPGADTTLVTSGAGVALTTRERLENHRQSPACSGCHGLIDPIGLGFENFDALGSFRSNEGGVPIDASGALDGVAFSGPEELADLIGRRSELPACLARNFVRYANARNASSGEEQVLAAITSAFGQAGYDFKSLVRAVLDSPSFVHAASPTR